MLNAEASLLRLSPVAPIDLGRDQDTSLERQRLLLMQQEFAETKRRNAEDAELRRMAEEGAQRRAELAGQRQQEKAAAAAKAAQEAEKRKLMTEVQKYRDAGDVEGIEALMGSMQASGMGVQRLGEDEYGLPTYQIDFDAEKAAAEEDARAAQASPYGPDESAVQSLDRLGALGYPSANERGNLDEPNLDAPITTEHAFDRALGASQHFDETGEPMRAPDAPDIMGAVPKNVIDFGAMQEQTARRLDPALGALQKAYPERYQDSVGETNDAVRGMALPANKALEQATAMRQGPDAALAKEFDEQSKAEPKPLTRQDIENLAKGGEARAKETFDNQDIPGVYHRSKAASSIIKLLSDKDPNNDLAIAFELPNMLGSRGAQSNKDLAVALGIDAMSTIDKIMERITNIVKGGFTEMRKESLIQVVQDKMEKDDELVYDFLDAIDESANSTQDPEVARGLRDYAARNVPKEYRDAWLTARDGDVEEPAPGGRHGTTTVERPGAQYDPSAVEPDDIEGELQAQAEEAGLDYEQIRPLMRTESGGDPTVKNKKGSSASGLFQFTDETARHYGLKNAAEYAALPPDKQIELALRRFKDIGLNEKSGRDDYAIANAAPYYVGKPDSTVIKQYKAGTPFGDDVRRKNPGWIPEDGGDITVGSIKAYYRGGKKASGEEKKASPKTANESPALRQQKERAKQKSRLDSDVDDILGE